MAVFAVSGALTACTPTTGRPIPGLLHSHDLDPGRRLRRTRADMAGRARRRRPVGATLNQYIVDNKIAETPFKKDDPGTQGQFPLPPGWNPADV